MFDDLRTELSIYGREHMITPNFDRLAKKSVVFDKAYSQIAVCNPSRDSLLTGLRPDTTGTFGFQSSFRPHLVFPTHFVRSGYNTLGIGKVAHWETDDKEIWNYDQWDDHWYLYQAKEYNLMNASVLPDQTRKEEDFRDYKFTTRFIQGIEKVSKEKRETGKVFTARTEPIPWMAAIGFKLPHLNLHLPYKYYKMYDNDKSTALWKLTKKELRFPASVNEVSYRCCAIPTYTPMVAEGTIRNDKAIPLGDINMPFTDDMHNEIMKGYCGSISYLDVQLGRILDTLDRLQLWDDTIIVLTSDHGMHNGEKGIWEKWSLFDESSRVPLTIYHPQSPVKGTHYSHPVELVDIYPTLLDLVDLPYHNQDATVCKKGNICHSLQGRSLAPLVMGDQWVSKHPGKHKKRTLQGKGGTKSDTTNSVLKAENTMDSILTSEDFGITQTWKCAKRHDLHEYTQERLRLLSLKKERKASKESQGEIPLSMTTTTMVNTNTSAYALALAAFSKKYRNRPVWQVCNRDDIHLNQIFSVMGYSIRTNGWRYNAYFPFDKKLHIPILSHDIGNTERVYAQELYDHRGETLADFTHSELFNVVAQNKYRNVTKVLHHKLVKFLETEVVHRGVFKG